MTFKARFGNLVIASLLLAGCGGGNDDIAVELPLIPVVNDKGTAVFNFVLARAVPSLVDSIEFFGYADNGQLVYGPAPRNKASQIVLESLPLSIRSFRLDYYDGDFLVGQGNVPVILSPNGRVSINDPAFSDVTVTDLAVFPETLEVTAGTTRPLNATATLSNGDSFLVADTAIYSSSDANVATVDSQGRVVGVGVGTANITVTYRDRTDIAVVTVLPAAPL